MSFKMPIAWLVRAINSSYLSMPSTLKRLCKLALGEGQKPVDNYVDTSPNGRSYPQASCFSQHQHPKADYSQRGSRPSKSMEQVSVPSASSTTQLATGFSFSPKNSGVNNASMTAAGTQGSMRSLLPAL